MPSLPDVHPCAPRNQEESDAIFGVWEILHKARLRVEAVDRLKQIVLETPPPPGSMAALATTVGRRIDDVR